MRHLKFIAASIAAYVLSISTAVAGVHAAPVALPEPGAFPLLAMGAAIMIITFRLRKKK